MKQPIQMALAGLVGLVVGYLLPVRDQPPPPTLPIEAAPVPVLPPVLTPIDRQVAIPAVCSADGNDFTTRLPIIGCSHVVIAVQGCQEYKVLSDTEAWARMAPQSGLSASPRPDRP